MKKSFTILILCFFFFAISVSAQEARKIDEWGPLQCEDYLARMDGVMWEAKNNPAATIYFFVYEGKEYNYDYRTNKKEKFKLPRYGSAKAKIRSIKARTKIFYENSLTQLVFIEAGFQEFENIEIWFVPSGAVTPKPKPTVRKMKYRKGKPRGFCIDCC